jgi:hypothetical protein
MIRDGLLFALALLSLSSANAADQLTALTLRQWCSGKAGQDQISCTAFTPGLINGINVADGVFDQKMKFWCFPNSITAEQAKLVIVKFMNEHPEVLHMGAAPVAAGALHLAFPCGPANEKAAK